MIETINTFPDYRPLVTDIWSDSSRTRAVEFLCVCRVLVLRHVLPLLVESSI